MKHELSIRAMRINKRLIHKMIIDEHARKHKDITDDVILELVKMLDGTEQLPDDVKDPYEYYVNLLSYEGKQYRMVWLLEKDNIYIGIITVYRDKRRK